MVIFVLVLVLRTAGSKIVLNILLQIKEEYRSIHLSEKTLMVEWQQLKTKILKLAENRPALTSTINANSDNLDEGTICNSYDRAFRT